MSVSTNTGNKERKLELSKAGLIKCSRCKYHKNENRSRRPRPDKYKNHRS